MGVPHDEDRQAGGIPWGGHSLGYPMERDTQLGGAPWGKTHSWGVPHGGDTVRGHPIGETHTVWGYPVRSTQFKVSHGENTVGLMP